MFLEPQIMKTKASLKPEVAHATVRVKRKEDADSAFCNAM